MKVCTKCKEEKEIADFNFKIKSKNIYSAHCRNCSRLYVKSHYKKNRDYYLAKAKKRNDRMREVSKRYVWNYLLKNACVDCGESDPIVLEFDHNSDKISAISVMYRNYTLDAIKKEIAKCKVRCANCHRRKTAIQFGWHKKLLPL